MFRLWCLLIGYPFGCILSACVVSMRTAGKTPFEFGSGNPGMANVSHVLGVKAGAQVLAGDILKTLIACLLTHFLFPGKWLLTVLYTGFGVVLGHNFPVWHRFRGGKGVSVSCSAIILSMPVPGILSSVIGLVIVLVTGFLPVGAVVIPGSYTLILLLLRQSEAAVIMLFYSLLMLQRHWKDLVSVKKGTYRRANPLGALKHSSPKSR